ncbi:MAG: double-strand break repair protein AddB [Rhodospirillales bacterium]|nr:MAG: double-strand break repair protein AddB [Rhodospirillales bacterium]
MADAPRGVLTIAADQPFVDALARGLLAAYGGDPLLFASVRVLLPTRRAARSLREAFLRETRGAPLLLPRLTPVGDVDEDDLAVAATPLGEESDAAFDIPPAIAPLEREAFLTRLVAGYGATSDARVAPSSAQALRLARELARLLDELTIEGVGFERLATVVDEGFASHWQRTLTFLKIVGENWPAKLAERGAIDAVDRRNRLLRAQAARWRAEPPAFPVVAAGSTGTQPATRELLAVVAGLPRGAVVLPGLDQELDDESWSRLDPTHPQFALRELLAALEVDRRAVGAWTSGERVDDARRRALSAVMRPAETTEGWSAGAQLDPESLPHVTRVDCATSQQEAVVVAMAPREALERPGRTAALVTPDRDLARRVAVELRRWDIRIDDSAGAPLAESPPGAFLRLVARLAAGDFAPLDLLAVLKHPLAALKLPRGRALAAVRRLDRLALRGPKPDPGLDAIAAIAEAETAKRPADRAALRDLIARLRTALAAVRNRPAEAIAATARLDALARAAEALAATDTETGAERLWRGDAGEALANAVVAWRDALGELPDVTLAEIPALLDQLLDGIVVRPRHGGHPRLAILGPLEARLQRADLLVLGGLNEGVWPPAVDTGPWLNRPMRDKLGLPRPERRVGLAAHDFAQAFAASEVLLTRADRVGGAPTVASRWLARLDALSLRGEDPRDATPDYVARGRGRAVWADALDAPQVYAPWKRPAPRPPLAARPRELSVSSIEQWRRDPYGLYARKILRLDRLDDIEATPGAAERGSALHATIERFLTAFPDTLPSDAVERMIDIGKQELRDLLRAPAERAFWWSRFERMAAWIVETERARRGGGARPLAHEIAGTLTLRTAGGPFAVTARADRIDRLADGSWEIIDYKTGATPSKRELEALYAPQLPLEAAIATGGGFKAGGAAPAAVALSYWRLNGQDTGGRIVAIDDAESLRDQTLAMLAAMVARFDDPAVPYDALPWPAFGPRFNDYEHLERVLEWSSGGDGESGGGDPS